jgi:hypothetical protein
MLEYTDKNNKRVRDFKKLAIRYMLTQFIWDFLPIIPFEFIVNFRYSRYLFILKLIRLKNGFTYLNVDTFMNFIKNYYG